MIRSETKFIQGFGCKYRVETVGLTVFGRLIPLWKKTTKVR